ncbi:MAG: PIN domain-containing protein [Patescibacteria group bacterium]|jgi:predicted nucleic acid-binding protein
MKVFIDADALIAIMKHDDINHDKAFKCLEKLVQQEVIFLTSNYVFAEVVTVLSQRVSQASAKQFINIMRSTDSPFIVRWVDEIIADEAVTIFEQQTSKNVSFVDCVNMALVKIDNIDQIFSFDSVYKKNKFVMVG